MKRTTKLLYIALPLFTALTLLALLSIGSIAQVGGTPDLIAYVLELAPRTMYAIAIGGSTTLAMRFAGMYVAADHRAKLIERAENGEIGPMIVLAGESLAWFGWAVLWAFVYLH